MCLSESPTPSPPSGTPDASKPADGAKEPCHTPCKLTSETGATSPADRTRTKIGVGEEVNLTITGNPAKWEITSGDGTLSPSTGTHSSVVFTAAEKNESVTIKAKCSGCDCEETITFNVTRPTSWKMVRMPGTNLRHNKGRPDCGWQGNMFVQPNDVNFYNVEIREKDSLSVATGSYKPSHHGKYHGNYPKPDRVSAWFALSSHTEADGSELGGEDTIYSGYPNFAATGKAPPFKVGKYYWEIVMQWKVSGSTDVHDFPTVRQEHEIFSDGKCETSKGGHSESSMYNDPTSTP
ncbi:MAG: hypothetical protein HKN33_03735 [Pyrinomonadaceae bacterium]|nr:hypothetical protein [Pyrinomonadaceae bacterium]